MNAIAFIRTLRDSERLLILEAVRTMYLNGNNYEEFCNIVDIDPEDCRDTFEKVVLYMDTVDSLE
jgi:hypothetical protein